MYSRFSHDSVAAKIGHGQRQRLFWDFMKRCHGVDRSVLDVGVTDENGPDANYLLKWYPHKDNLTSAGLMVNGPCPGIRYVQIEKDRLPFANQSFDVVHSSAVIEHVGDWRAQWWFLAELWRVSRRALYVTTPNRWAPIEFHTAIPLLHWLPRPLWSWCVGAMGDNFYAKKENLRLLGARGLEQMALRAGIRTPTVYGVKLWGWTSNLVLFAERPA